MIRNSNDSPNHVQIVHYIASSFNTQYNDYLVCAVYCSFRLDQLATRQQHRQFTELLHIAEHEQQRIYTVSTEMCISFGLLRLY